jgi:hypothetical protein
LIGFKGNAGASGVGCLLCEESGSPEQRERWRDSRVFGRGIFPGIAEIVAATTVLIARLSGLRPPSILQLPEIRRFAAYAKRTLVLLGGTPVADSNAVQSKKRRRRR